MKRGGPAPRFLAIVGPTGAGKTRLSLLAAEALKGEIVSMDSRQVYRGLDIGTAKVGLRERGQFPHHGIDIRDPGERYSAGEFGRDARRWIAAIAGRGRVPILAGGTGFFLKVLTDPIVREPLSDPGRKAALEAFLRALAQEEMERWVARLDPGRAEVAAAGGCQRLVRTLVVTLLTGRSLSWWHRYGPLEGEPLHGVVCAIEVPAGVLSQRIDHRTRAMIAEGLVDEVARLLAAGCRPDDAGLNAVGYREVVEHLAGRISLEEAVTRTTAATRRYARRQRTWFRGQLGPDAVTVDGTARMEEQLATVVNAWRKAA